MLLLSLPHIMINERSFGVIPLQLRSDGYYLFLVQHSSYAWLLPKGHAEPSETPKETASRELVEETALKVVEWLDHAPFIEHYRFKRGEKEIYKEATYFPALVEGETQLQTEELLDGKWIPIKEFSERATFPEMKRIASEVSSWLSGKREYE